MSSYRPVAKDPSFPELEERVLERWRERDVFDRSLANREGAEVWRLLRGPADRQRPPAQRPRPHARLQGPLPALQDDARLPRAAQGGLGHATACRSRSRSRRSSASTARRRSRSTASTVQPALPRVGLPYSSEWERLTERIGFWVDLDDAYVTYHDDYIESVWWALQRALEEGPASTRATRSCPWCPRCGTALSLARGRRSATSDVDGPDRLRALPAASTRTPRRRSSSGRRRPWTLPSNVALAVERRTSTTCGRKVGDERPDRRRGAASSRCSARARRSSRA